MKPWQLQTPVAIIVFNRPEPTAKVFAAIRQAKPPKLFLIADGPRSHKAGEAEKCAQVRKIVQQVDWECEVYQNFADTNLGCGRRPATGIDWVFRHVEEAIIIEDDCLPDPSFFRFCQEMLERYRHDERIMTICGLNVQFGRRRTASSYYFSRYNHCWGWASWRRAWQYFDYEMKLWPQVRDKGFLSDLLLDSHAVKNWTNTYQMVYEQKLDCWDFQWTFACWLQSGLAILPNSNLISYIGCGSDATHTTAASTPYSNLPVEPMTFPLRHPDFILRDNQADCFTQNTYYDYHPSLLKKVNRKVKKLLGVPNLQTW